MMYVPPGQSADFYRRFQDWLQGRLLPRLLSVLCAAW